MPRPWPGRILGFKVLPLLWARGWDQSRVGSNKNFENDKFASPPTEGNQPGTPAHRPQQHPQGLVLRRTDPRGPGPKPTTIPNTGPGPRVPVTGLGPRVPVTGPRPRVPECYPSGLKLRMRPRGPHDSCNNWSLGLGLLAFVPTDCPGGEREEVGRAPWPQARDR